MKLTKAARAIFVAVVPRHGAHVGLCGMRRVGGVVSERQLVYVREICVSI